VFSVQCSVFCVECLVLSVDDLGCMIKVSGFGIHGLGIRVHHCDVAKGFEVRVNDGDGCACLGWKVENLGVRGARIVPETLTACYVSRGGCARVRYLIPMNTRKFLKCTKFTTPYLLNATLFSRCVVIFVV
jgi:hypothetical protein